MDNLMQQQQALTAYLRDPDHQPLPANMNPARVNGVPESGVQQRLGAAEPDVSGADPDHWRNPLAGTGARLSARVPRANAEVC